MVDVQVIQVNFSLGKLLHFGDRYKSAIIKKAIYVQRSSNIRTFFLNIIVSPDIYLEYKHTTLHETIHHINDAIYKYLAKARYDKYETDPTDVQIIYAEPLLFASNTKKPFGQMDIICKKANNP